MHLQLVNLQQNYGGAEVLRGLSFTLEAGDIACLLGPSGCGKTTALRCIAGFEDLTQGEILVAGDTLSRAGYTYPAERRKIGMVFQDAALLPHLDALRNVA
ncbi:MAG: ATP-binding cassette domain-containing protein, partial [Gammaproteobacteria bacterium]|nr:ATP-binding cassette domain-containing protein [Gammaproteobacteria bacterium]